MTGIKVLLTGGPTTLSEKDRIQEVRSLDEKVKLAWGNSRQHFTYTGTSQELNGTSLPLFGWCDQTKLAE